MSRGSVNPYWADCCCDINWGNDLKHRRKPKTININGYDVPEPVREPLVSGIGYAYPSTSSLGCGTSTWSGEETDMKRLSAGIIHLTREDAQLHLNALLSFTENKDG